MVHLKVAQTQTSSQHDPDSNMSDLKLTQTKPRLDPDPT